ncbi:MAG: citrate transporter [Thermoanaerobaculum sp.]|nr:MAG: citrate transporter [Thermoanaerobaculum sp.]
MDLGTVLPAWSGLPFAGILLSIALFPLLAPHFWHHHYPKVAAFWALILLVPFVSTYGAPAIHEVLHMAIVDYIPFIILIGTLFTIGGGIYVRGSLRGTPAVNAAIMLIGTALASWIGTTGAAMLLIRPLLRANKHRRYRSHTVVFFIFLVANIGGAHDPLWVTHRCFWASFTGCRSSGRSPSGRRCFWWPPSFWVPTSLWTATFGRGKRRKCGKSTWVKKSSALKGWHNFFFSWPGYLAAVIASGVLHLGEVNILGVHQHVQNLLRDAFLLAMFAGSWLTTPRQVRKENEFSWEPIREVAILFAGIFATIIPPLAMLRAGEHGALAFIIKAVQTPAHFFWATGSLSSFLDNAPTYLTFLSTALGRLYPGVPERQAILQLISENHAYLQAIATGAVFMGANTYIGNAPNFMVKSIAEEQGVPMPSFFGYIFKYTLPVLIPTFILATLVFFG